MIKDATKQIIKRTLQSSFDKEQFLNFTKNLLNHINEDKAFHAHGYVKEQFKKTANIIKTYERLGTYTDPNEKKIDILVVYLAKDNSIDRARTSLRNFVADYLKGRDQKDAALVAFVSPSQDDWRFSLIKMEYKFEEGQSGKMKVKEEFTPARRWSFLVGSKESSHTAQSRLAPILEDDESSPTLEQLEDAFNIEKVTKEFFEKYRELFLGLKDNLDEMVKKDAKIRADFAEKDVDTVDFAKKLLGQIVFLYFLQKKGWFGVERDANWGTGPKDFLRQLYNKKHSDYKNFFNEILEPMFYEALARERDDDYYGSFNCKIPFLNGGLFDPIGNYDWVHTDINLDNELFSNSRPTKQGDIGDGILDVFDRYNFTVREDEPLEKEVAVDPEMLGKVFENLLEVKDRKSKGTYYTPREIVHYMCEQSLINYLSTELPEVDKNDLEEFIKIGDQVLENEYWIQEKGDDNGSKIPASIKKNAEIIDQKLAEIKVCDPAIGSGAFPVGMMGEIVNARLSLNPYLCHSGRSEESPSLECAGRTAYDFKMQAITDSIYGVDIDPGAVEIAKLRLWLSLVVDENDIKQIKPLPNLDYKIMQGNSLLEEFEGIKLFDESIIPQDHADREAQIANANEKINELQREFFRLHSKNELSKSQEQLIKQQIKGQQKLIQSLQEKPKQGGTVDLFNQIDEIKAKWDELTGLHKKIVNESNRQEKRQMLDRASELEWQFVEASLRKEGKLTSLSKVEKYKKLNTKPFFLWHLHFADVFQTKSGFDVVIANPPYVGVKGNSDLFDPIKKSALLGEYFVGRAELFYFFFHLALKIGKDNSSISFITTDYYSTATYGNKLRQDIKDKAEILSLIDFNELKIFESALGQHNMITVLRKTQNRKSIANNSLTSRQGISTAEILRNILHGLDNQTIYYTVDQNSLFEGPDNYIRIGGTSVGNNVINGLLNKLSSGSLLEDLCLVRQGLRTGIDKTTNSHRLNYGYQGKLGEGVFVVDDEELKNINPTIKEQDIIKDFYKNSNIAKYYSSQSANSHVLYITNYNNEPNFKNEFPNIYSHIRKFKELITKIRARNNEEISHWYILDRTRENKIFDSPKIVVPQRSYTNTFGYNETDWYASADVYFIIQNNESVSLKYILALLNSKLYYIWLYYRGKRKGNMLELYQKPLSEIPIKEISGTDQKPFVEIVNKILDLTKSDDYISDSIAKATVKEYEHQIDQMVYKLYGLTAEEIKIIEASIK